HAQQRPPDPRIRGDVRYQRHRGGRRAQARRGAAVGHPTRFGPPPATAGAFARKGGLRESRSLLGGQMFVEIARLLIVLLATGAGYGIARSNVQDGSVWVVVGAVLGALFGYVLGGVAARTLRRGMGRVEATVDRTPPAQLLGGG